jgi:DNA-3-methyladenine glycosylase II
MYEAHGTLTAASPFDFNQSLRFLGEFLPAMGHQVIDSGTLTKAVSHDGSVIVFRVRSTGTIDSPQIGYALFSETVLTDEIREYVEDRISFFLSLADNLLPFYAIGRSDSDFAPIIQQLYGYHQVKFLTPFESVCWALLTTRNRIAIACNLKDQIVERFGQSMEVDGIRYAAFPEPEVILGASAGELAEIVSHMRRAEYIIGAAQAFAEVDEMWLREANADEVENWLRKIKGIGPWSASLIMIRALGRMDRLMVPEKNLVTAASRCYGRPLTEDEILKLAARYGDYQGYWAHYLRAAM